ncbi:sugar nucleotide-binding protein, partial [Klebsiella variicola]
MKILLTGARGMVGQNILSLAGEYEHEFLSPSSAQLNLLDSNAVHDYIRIHKP